MEVVKIIELQQKAYRLLKWVEKAMNSQIVSPVSAHDKMSDLDAAQDWVAKHSLNFPPDARPNIDDKNELKAFSNLFMAFLQTSFDIEATLKEKYISYCGCHCSMCSYLGYASYLKPKKVKPADKRRARKLKLYSLQQLFLDLGSEDENSIDKLMESDDSFEDIAIVAYTDQLKQRSEGIYSGPAALQLWRDFAWTKKGSPKRGFKYSFEMFKIAESRLKDKIANG